MKGLLRGVLYLLAATLLALVALAAYLAFSFDINDHRDRLASEIQRHTGRALNIGGEIGLSIFPWLGVEARDLSLANLPEFGDAPLARVAQLEARARLLPMLRGELEIDRIVVDGLFVELVRKADGSANWASPQAAPADAPQAQATDEDGPSAPDLGAAALAIGTLELRSARISLTDHQAGTRHTLDALQFTSAAVRPGAPFPVELAFQLDSGAIGADAERTELAAKLRTQATFDPAARTLTLAELQLETGLKGAAIPGGALDATLTALATVDLERGSAVLENLSLATGDTRITGRFALTDPAGPALEFDLHADRLDVDRYLPAQSPSAAPTPGAAAAAGAASGAAAAPDAVTTLAANGRLRIDSLSAAGLKLSALELTLNADKGLVRLDPLSAQLYGGQYQGKVALDARRTPMRLSLDDALQGVQVAPLLRELSGSEARVSGRADVRARLQADAGSAEQLKRSLAGRIEVRVNDGAIKGVNIAQMMREASARLRGETVSSTGPNETDFTELSATLNAARGVLHNDDLAMRSPLLRIGGAGKASLVSETLDYVLRTSVVATLAGQGGEDLDNLRGVTVPIRVTGPFAAPKFALDIESLIKDSVRDKAREKLEEKLREKLPGGVQEQLPDKLREGLGRFLR